MRRRRLAVVLGALCTLAACPKPPSGTSTGAGADASGDRAALVLPPTDASAAALARITRRARSGDTAAAWARSHYLIELFDEARFARTADSLRALAAAIDVPMAELRGASGTNRAIAALQLEVDAVLGADRLHAGAQRASTLLAADATPPTNRDQVLQRMAELKAVARTDAPMAANANLRLMDYCVRALEDALVARWSVRTRRAAHCLYPLYESDPAPYFARDPSRRPPPPLAAHLIGDVRRRIAAQTKGRLFRAWQQLSRRLDAIAAAAPAAIVPPPDPTALQLPSATSATPYDWTPLLHPQTTATLSEQTKQLEQAVLGDGRRVVAVVAPRTATADVIVKAAGIAHAVGAAHIELVVALTQRLEIPKGDYWAGRTKAAVVRAGVLPLSLHADAKASGARPAQGPREWDPSRATLGLVLHLERSAWQLAGSDGELATIRAGDVNALRLALVKVRDAYDFEQGLAVVAAGDASYAHLVSAIDGVARDADGTALFPRIALRAVLPKYSEHGLARRIARRAAAKVSIDPARYRRQSNLVRRCYQNLLEDTPMAKATIRVAGATAAVQTTSGTRDANLATCIQRAMQDAMSGAPDAAATITLTPR